MRKRIAIIVAQIDEATQKKFIHGFTEKAYALDYDICIFSMYQKFQESPIRNVGDSNIYNLINFDLFDGIVFLIDTILFPGYGEALEKKMSEIYDGPVIVIDRESEYFESVMIDHYTPLKKIVDHLIEVHEYRSIAYLGGKEGHPHSVQRHKAFMDSMKNHGLEVREDWVYHGNYWYDSGESFVELLLKDREHMPEAIVCANDIMAIGVAGALTDNGIRVPEDIALVGYDSIEDGRNSPSPLTSADIPADECGNYAIRWLHSVISGDAMEDFEPKSSLYIGGSCGCKYEIEMVPKKIRLAWRTQQSSRSMYSDFNHLLEDLLSQTNMNGFWSALSSYVFQIRPFHSFEICMNETFMETDKNIGEDALRKGYTKNMCRVLSCRENGENTVDFENRFSTRRLTPMLYEERPYPTTFIFNPLFFEDRCFGYSILNYGSENKVYEKSYRLWMRDVMQGMEAFYRQQYLQDLVNKVRANQIRDSLTGLYNYEGFLGKTLELIKDGYDYYEQLNILTVDIKGLRTINEFYGREYGDKTINNIAKFISSSIDDNQVCARLCNDEFLIALIDDESCSKGQKIMDKIIAKASSHNEHEDSDHKISFHQFSSQGKPSGEGSLERLINYTISVKNHTKAMYRKNEIASTKAIDDEMHFHQLVSHILNENELIYHYQPIVNVKDGSIYAYEALMRSEEEGLTPFKIIQSAKYLNRLDDVERHTLLNVTRDISEHIEQFGDSKIFINSLPSHQLSGEADKLFEERCRELTGRLVIEFTEEAELSDEELTRLKAKHSLLGNEIAIDDFGSGYSNVNNLLRYKPRYVKIDKELITDIQNNPQKEHFVRNTIEYAHNNGILALAEGVENRDELRKCIRLGVDLIQGFYTGRPKREPVGAIPKKISSEIERFYNQRTEW